MTLDDALKLVQIAFYVTVSSVTILTYLSAKRGLLNSVNTEYKKHVIERLKELSDEFLSEFDPSSENYWARNSPMKEIIEGVNNEFLEDKEHILSLGEFYPSILVGSDEQRLKVLETQICSDPFIPRKIREAISVFLRKRTQILGEVRFEVVESYAANLAQGKHLDKLDENWNWVHNKMVTALCEKGCGVTQVDNDVQKLRLSIQTYLESYDPLS